MNLKDELRQIDAELKRLEARKRELYELSTKAPEHEKLCEDSLAVLLAEEDLVHSIEYPIEVTGIHITGNHWLGRGLRRRGLVRVRPCAEEFGGQTFLGLYLGDLARNMGCAFNRKTGVLEMFLGAENPAIWVPSRECLVFGCESWWGPLQSEEQLKAITNEAIDGIWYVQAMKALLSPGRQHAEG